jgi:hypothetical protein
VASGDSKDLQTQSDLQSAINNSIKERAGLLSAVTEQLGQQLQMQRELCAAMDCKSIEDSTARVGDLNAALRENRQNIDDSSSSTEQLNSELKKTKKIGAKAKGALVGAFVGFKNAIGSAFGAFKSLMGGIMSLPGSIMRIGGAILGAWGSMTSGLMDMAQSGGGGGKPILDSLEKVRASMGDLAGPASQGVIKGWKNMKSAGGELAAGGASLTKIFGRGRAGLAAQLDFMRESAEALGPVFHTMTDQIGNAAGALVRIRKGLGLSDDALQNMARSAKANGETLKDALDETARSTAYLSKRFGLSAKAIGKNLSEIQGDMATFGEYTRAEMAGVAAAMVKVGMEMKDLQGITGKTDDFESAANAVAGLSEAFGMQLDTMELMTADPAKKAEMMRDAFHQAGKSFEDMSRQEKARLADLSGMSQDALQGFLDPSNAGMQFDDFTDAAKDGADGAISQAEANKILTKSIEKLNETMGGLSGKKGFLGLFLDGVKKGISTSPEFRDLMHDIREAMRVVYQAGKEVGRMLMELFSPTGPLYPVMKIFKDYFSPAKWMKRMVGVKQAFRNFVDMMKRDPSAALAGLLKDLRKVFLDGGGGEFAQTIKEGLVKGIDVIGSMILGAIPTLLGWIRDGMMALLSLLKGETSFSTAFFDDVAFPMVMEAWGDLVKQAGPILREMGDAIMEMLNMFWAKYGDKIKNFFGGILTALFVAAIIKAAAAAAVGAAVGWAVKELMNKMKSAGGGLSGDDAPGGGGGGGGGAEESMAEKLKGVVEALKQITMKDIGKAILIAGALVLFIYGALMLMTLAFKQAADIVKDLGPEDVLKTAGVWITIAGSMLAVGLAIMLTKDMDWKDMAKAVGVMLGTILVLGLLGVLLGTLISSMPDMDIGKVVAWGTVMAVGIASAGIAMWAAAKVADMGISWGDLIKGLIVMGVVMLALGGIGWILVKMLKDSASPAQMTAIGVLMMALAVMFGVIALAIPAAAMLGMMLAASPWGAAGVAIIILGFVALGMLAIAMVESLVPTIATLGEIARKIPNVDAFKAVTDAIVGILTAIGKMMGSVAKLGRALMPGPFKQSGEKFSDSMDSMGDFIDKLIKGNIKPIIKDMIDLAKDAEIKEEGVAAVQAIGSMLGALAEMLSAFSPSDGAMQSLMEANNSFAGADAVAILDATTRNTRAMGKQAKMLVTQVKEMITGEGGLMDSLKGQDFTKVGPILESIGPMLQGVAGMLKSMSPSDAAFQAIAEAADTYGEDSVDTTNAIMGGLQRLQKSVKPLIKEIGKQMSGVIKAIVPAIRAMKGIDPVVMESFGKIISALFKAMGGMMGTAGPAIQAAMKTGEGKKGKVNPKKFKDTLGKIGEFISTLGESMGKMIGPIVCMVDGIRGVAEKIKDPKKLLAQAEALGSLIEIIGDIASIFGPKGPLSSVPPVDKDGVAKVGADSPLVSATKSVQGLLACLFEKADGAPDGILNALIDSFANKIKISDAGKVAENAKVLGEVMDSISKISGVVSAIAAMDTMTDEAGTINKGQLKIMFATFAATFGPEDKYPGVSVIPDINDIIAGFNTISGKIPKLSLIKSAAEFLDVLNPMVNSLAYMTELPDNVTAKICKVEESFVALTDFINTAGTNPELKAAIEIGRALAGEGKVTVQHENVKIEMTVDVTLNAHDIVKVLVNEKQWLNGGGKWQP